MIDIKTNNEIPALALAYLGDSIYEIYVRSYLLNDGIVKVNDLQSMAINYVSAKNQTKFLNYMIDNNILNEEELLIVNRARNQKCNHKPKNTDIITYKYSTGFEALIGYLYINKRESRIDELFKIIIGR